MVGGNMQKDGNAAARREKAWTVVCKKKANMGE